MQFGREVRRVFQNIGDGKVTDASGKRINAYKGISPAQPSKE